MFAVASNVRMDEASAGATGSARRPARKRSTKRSPPPTRLRWTPASGRPGCERPGDAPRLAAAGHRDEPLRRAVLLRRSARHWASAPRPPSCAPSAAMRSCATGSRSMPWRETHRWPTARTSYPMSCGPPGRRPGRSPPAGGRRPRRVLPALRRHTPPGRAAAGRGLDAQRPALLGANSLRAAVSSIDADLLRSSTRRALQEKVATRPAQGERPEQPDPRLDHVVLWEAGLALGASPSWWPSPGTTTATRSRSWPRSRSPSWGPASLPRFAAAQPSSTGWRSPPFRSRSSACTAGRSRGPCRWLRPVGRLRSRAAAGRIGVFSFQARRGCRPTGLGRGSAGRRGGRARGAGAHLSLRGGWPRPVLHVLVAFTLAFAATQIPRLLPAPAAASEPWSSFGAYVHFPYCRSICPYCDFAVEVAARAAAPALRRAVLRELEPARPGLRGARTAAQRLLRRRYAVALGAAPSLARSCGGSSGRFGLPAGPPRCRWRPTRRISTSDRLRALRELGVNRSSWGVQSFETAPLRTLGRGPTATRRRGGLALSLEVGFPASRSTSSTAARPAAGERGGRRRRGGRAGRSPCLGLRAHARRAGGRRADGARARAGRLQIRPRRAGGAGARLREALATTASAATRSRTSRGPGPAHNLGYWEGRALPGAGRGRLWPPGPRALHQRSRRRALPGGPRGGAAAARARRILSTTTFASASASSWVCAWWRGSPSGRSRGTSVRRGRRAVGRGAEAGCHDPRAAAGPGGPHRPHRRRSRPALGDRQPSRSEPQETRKPPRFQGGLVLNPFSVKRDYGLAGASPAGFASPAAAPSAGFASPAAAASVLAALLFLLFLLFLPAWRRPGRRRSC